MRVALQAAITDRLGAKATAPAMGTAYNFMDDGKRVTLLLNWDPTALTKAPNHAPEEGLTPTKAAPSAWL